MVHRFFEPHALPLSVGPGRTLGDQDDVSAVHVGGDFVQQGTFNLNGIEAALDGGTLIDVQSSTGTLFTIDPASGVANAIDLGGESVPAGDGILLHGRMLFVVQNQLNQVAVIRLAPDLLSGVVKGRILGPIRRPDDDRSAGHTPVRGQRTLRCRRSGDGRVHGRAGPVALSFRGRIQGDR